MKGHRCSSVQLRIIFIFVVGLFLILQSPKFARSAGNFNPLCNSHNEVIKTNSEAIDFAKKKLLNPDMLEVPEIGK
jgi:hypothetical protein